MDFFYSKNRLEVEQLFQTLARPHSEQAAMKPKEAKKNW